MAGCKPLALSGEIDVTLKCESQRKAEAREAEDQQGAREGEKRKEQHKNGKESCPRGGPNTYLLLPPSGSYCVPFHQPISIH